MFKFRTRKEIVIASILCLIYFFITVLFTFQYSHTLTNLSPSPKVFAQESIKGITTTQTPLPSPTTPIATLMPTESPQPTPTAVQSDTVQSIDTRTVSPTSSPTPSAPAVTNSNESQDILNALNAYRAKKGISPLVFDDKLQSFAQSRADQFASQGDMDNHAGFQAMMNDNGFAKMGFNALGENSSYGDFGTAQNLIESLYGGHPPHDENQLKSDWTHVGIGVKGVATDLVFGGRKI